MLLMAMGSFLIKRTIVTKDNGKIIVLMGRAVRNLLMEMSTKVLTSKERNAVKAVYIFGVSIQTISTIKENSRTTR
jgi:hypothetical protein